MSDLLAPPSLSWSADLSAEGAGARKTDFAISMFRDRAFIVVSQTGGVIGSMVSSYKQRGFLILTCFYGVAFNPFFEKINLKEAHEL